MSRFGGSYAVLLLDEATAAIASASEAALRASVSSQDRAVLAVAHRLSTAKEAEQVLVMEEGRIVEEGTPEDLMRRQGRFTAMLELEAAGWDWRVDGRTLSQWPRCLAGVNRTSICSCPFFSRSQSAGLPAPSAKFLAQ
ncbi:MAG: hypothetical protein VCB79_13780 [Dehalococcoidia bacterium]